MTSVNLRHVSLLCLLAVTAGCRSEGTDEPVTEVAMNTASIADMPESRWLTLRSRNIFFGHQSVGENIMAGVRRVLADHPEIGVRLVSSADPAAVEGPAFIDAPIGVNERPATKSQAFSAILEGGFGNTANAVAMYKFCYVDVNAGTDPDQMFAEYVQQIEDIRKRFPNTQIVHFTLPLRTASTGVKEQINVLLRRPTQTLLNMKRNRYNELLRERFGGSDHIFDLALLESTRPDGSRAYSRYFGDKAFMLAPEWTDDGGHLNEAAQYHVAERLLVFLATLDPSSTDRLSTAGSRNDESLTLPISTNGDLADDQR